MMMKIVGKFIDIIIFILNLIFIPVIFIAAFISRYANKKYDVGLGPMPINSIPYFKKSLEYKGYTAQTYVTHVYKITNDFDCMMDNRIYRILPVLRVIPVLFKYRCIYLFFDGGVLATMKIFRFLEAYLYKVAKIKTVITPYGADSTILSRTRNICVKNALLEDYNQFYKTMQGRVIWQVDYWSKNADAVAVCCDSVYYLPYWNYIRASVLSVDLKKMKPKADFKFHAEGEIRIVHAPNHTSVKGTEFIEQAIDRLMKEGFPIKYIRLQGKTNDEVLRIIEEADIVIDQIIGGWHGMFALEAMAFAKPVITHIRNDLLQVYEEIGCMEKGELPLIDATPTTIYDVLKGLLENLDSLEIIGKKSLAYVEKYQSVEAIGDFFDKINRDIGILPSGITGKA